MLREYKLTKIYQGSLKKGADIIGGLTQVIKERGITVGVVSGIGAVTEAHIGYFNAQTKKYEEVHFRENMEILSLRGNVSIKDGDVFPHLHVVLSKRDFSAVGGHLYAGTTVYAFEFEIVSMEGAPFVRQFDNDTGLFLWKE
jgi:predicted DNA-binding protein with PD1-like motif